MVSDARVDAKTESAIRQVQKKIPAELFPLPLSPFEKFVLWDERPSQPMTTLVELHFASQLDHERLQHALAFATHCHPLLASRVKHRNGELFWEYDAEYRPSLRWEHDFPCLDQGRLRPFDLSHQCGLRVWHKLDAAESRIIVQLHHACCDGVGLRRMLIDMLAFYARASKPDGQEAIEPTWERLEPGLLRERFDFATTFSTPLRPLSAWQRIKNAHYFHFQLPRPLAAGGTLPRGASRDSMKPVGDELLAHTVFDRETTCTIADRCRAEHTNLNEVGLALLFQTCSLWNQMRDRSSSTARLRVLMPYELLSRKDLKMPAANRLSFAFVGRTQRQCQDLDALIKSIQAEIRDIRQTRLPLDFLGALTAASRFPWLMKFALRRSRRMCTAVLTYSGDLSRGMLRTFPQRAGEVLVGDARLTRVLAAPPVRDNTHIALCLCSNWGELCISAAWNRDVLSAQECGEFVALYRAGWLRWLESPLS